MTAALALNRIRIDWSTVKLADRITPLAQGRLNDADLAIWLHRLTKP